MTPIENITFAEALEVTYAVRTDYFRPRLSADTEPCRDPALIE